MTEFDKDKFNDEKSVSDINQPSKEEIKDLLVLPAIYANRFYLANQEGSMVRITFSEEIEKNIANRYSVIMSIKAFMSFTQLITNTANSIAAQMAQQDHLRKMMQANVNAPSSPIREELK